MPETISPKIIRKYLWAGIAVLAILVAGTVGYRVIGGEKSSLVDCLYMTMITITSIGYGEIIDLSNNPGGRIFTMFIAVAGIGVLGYILMNATAFVVEGRINEAFWRKRMEKTISNLKKHYIICGVDGVGFYILSELHATGRPYVLVDLQRKPIDRALEFFPGQFFIEGDPTDDATLMKAGIGVAEGIFAVTGDDNQNLVISLTAKQLNPQLRVVACCNDIKSTEKIKKVGADAVVSPSYIGGLRMASEMIRPAVVSFLDIMLRRKDENMRVEEVMVPQHLIGVSISKLDLKKYPSLLLLAVKSGDDWLYNPPREHVMKSGDVLIFMATALERSEIETALSSAPLLTSS
jgi:voltage-gated potassium channel